MTKRTWAAVVTAGALALGGCSSGGYDTGADDSKPFDTLTADETRLACENLSDYLFRQVPLDEQYEINCTIEALGSTSDPDACRSAVTSCLAGTAEPLFDDIDCTMTSTVTDCSAPVGNVEQCVTADLDAYVDRLDRIDCAIAGNLPALMELQAPVPVPDACTRLEGCAEYRDGIIGR